jgi:hypothetical protein
MGKRENHVNDLLPLFEAFIATSDDKQLLDYLTSNSNLPGPRGNLELAEAFGDAIGQRAEKDKLYHLCRTMTDVTADEAPVGDPSEFISFCGAVGIGALGAASPTLFVGALEALQTLANDSRWRMREAVRMGLHRLVAARSREALQTLGNWIEVGSALELRAVAAGVAEPTLLKDNETAQAALELHQAIFSRVLTVEDRKSDAFKALRKGLGYTLSLVVQALPEAGFHLMRELVATQDKDVVWIVEENLKKNRLTKNFPARVESIKSSVGATQ